MGDVEIMGIIKEGKIRGIKGVLDFVEVMCGE